MAMQGSAKLLSSLDIAVKTLRVDTQYTAGPGPGSLGSPTSPQQGGQSPQRTSPPRVNTARGRSVATETMSSSKLYRDISPTKMYTMSQDAVGVSLPDLFKQRQGLEHLRPAYSLQQAAGVDDATSPPKLLQSLETLLAEKQAMISEVASPGQGYAALKIEADAHRQVFDALLHSFTTYKDILQRVKAVYDGALDDALSSVYDNTHMNLELLMTERHMADAERNARERALRDAAASQQEIRDEVDQQEAGAAEAEARCQRAEAEMAAVKAQTAQLRIEIRHLTGVIAEHRSALISASSFASPALLARLQGPAAEGAHAGHGHQQTATPAVAAAAAAAAAPATSGAQ